MFSGDSSIYYSWDYNNGDDDPEERLRKQIEQYSNNLFNKFNFLNDLLLKINQNDKPQIYGVLCEMAIPLKSLTRSLRYRDPENPTPIQNSVKDAARTIHFIKILEAKEKVFFKDPKNHKFFKELNDNLQSLITFLLQQEKREIHPKSLKNEQKTIEQPKLKRKMKDRNIVHLPTIEDSPSIFSKIKKSLATNLSALKGFMYRTWINLFVSRHLDDEISDNENQEVKPSCFRSTCAILFSCCFPTARANRPTYVYSPAQTRSPSDHSYLHRKNGELKEEPPKLEVVDDSKPNGKTLTKKTPPQFTPPERGCLRRK